MMTSPLPASVAGLSELAPRYDLLLCDIWGVVHNGLSAHRAACEALERFRAAGGNVVLVSNAPRPNREIVRQLASLEVPSGCYDAIVTSGDVTLAMIAEHAGEKPFHLGPARDASLFDLAGVQRVPLEQADYVVCTGLVDDETETPDDYRRLLEDMLSASLPMICANPDLVVERGDRMIYCAGALADLYRDFGGAVAYAGKPHGPIYRTATATAQARRGQTIEKSRILAIGDAIRTDVIGAHDFGVDVVFVTAGIHAADLHAGNGDIEHARLPGFFAEAGRVPNYLMRNLFW